MKIHGNKILNFPIGEIDIEQTCDFFIKRSSHDFIIETNSFSIEAALELYCKNESIHKDYLFCLDENKEKFTLFDCYIMPVQIPVKQVKVIWNKCLLGEHFQNIQDVRISSAKYILQADKRCPFHLFIWKSQFDVFDGTVHVSVDWNMANSKAEGVCICLDLENVETISWTEKIILRMLEIYFLQMGFFPKIEECEISTENKKVCYFIEDFAAYGKTSGKNIRLDYVLEIKDNIDFSIVFEKWWKLREKEVVTFNLFSYLTTESSPVREVPIATYIQCLEGYFRIHHAEKMIKFSESTKNQIKKEITKLLDSAEELKLICKENGLEVNDIKESINRMSGRINEYSLNDILRYAINRSPSTRRLFEFEQNTKINDQKYLVDIFVSKSLGHRNWLSHLTRQRSRFTGKEIDLAERKLRLLFRLTLLQDIGCEATEESLDRTVRVVDQWYKSNQLK